MKLATRKNGSRDGQLMVVARNLKTAVLADAIAPTLQRALDDWHCIGPQLEALSVLLNAGMAVHTDDVPMGTTPAQAASRICLLMLVNDVSLRHLIPAELAKGFGFMQAKPASSFSPVAVTPDELGEAWRDGKVCLPLCVSWNGVQVGAPDAGVDMVFNFPQLIAHLAVTRNARAGSIIGSGTVSNRDGAKGYTCIAEKRCLEMIAGGEAITPFMQFGDTVRIEMFDATGESVFGAISQRLVQHVYDAVSGPNIAR